MSLRDLDPHTKAIDTCVYCPKLCRFACPVAEAETRETVTPWGLMTRLDDIRRGRAPLDEASAELFAHCTGCRRCEAVCKHDNPVADVVRAARALSVQADLANPKLDAWSKERPKPARALGRLKTGTAVQILAGSAPNDVILAAVELLRAAGYQKIGRPADGVTHSGVRALEVGRPGAFASGSGRTAAALFGARTVVCLEAEDVLGLTRDWPGAPLDFDVLHLVDAVAERLPARRAARAGDVLYLDDCRLAHGLGTIESPRTLLGESIEGTVFDALMSGDEGGCCGAGAGYAAIAPAAARRVAEEAVEIEPDIPVVVASGRCVDHLRESLPDREVIHWAVLVAAALKSPKEVTT